MMCSDNVIADLCRRAGFVGDALHIAIASALAASGGLAEYEHVVYPGPVAIYQGLWGVNLCEHDSLIGADLKDPFAAAASAYELTAASGTFAWCPAFRTGAYVAFLDRAAVASSQSPYNEPLQVPSTFHAVRRTIDQHHDDAHDARSLIMHRHDTRSL